MYREFLLCWYVFIGFTGVYELIKYGTLDNRIVVQAFNISLLMGIYNLEQSCGNLQKSFNKLEKRINHISYHVCKTEQDLIDSYNNKKDRYSSCIYFN